MRTLTAEIFIDNETWYPAIKFLFDDVDSGVKRCLSKDILDHFKKLDQNAINQIINELDLTAEELTEYQDKIKDISHAAYKESLKTPLTPPPITP